MLINDQEQQASLKMVSCGGCGAKIFIDRDLEPLATKPCGKCGHPVMKPMFLGQIELREVIASGGMGTVYRSWDHALERTVAVKLMNRQFVDDVELVEAFAKEAKMCAGLNHTNIISIFSFDEQDGEKYLVMELTDQGSLEGRINNDGHVPELQVLDIGIKMCSALKAAQKHDLVHLDIKPDNILFNADYEPKLVDWGIARRLTEEVVEDEDGIMGTPEFIAPERVQRQGETILSDMYSLAGTLYNALTGRLPFSGDDPVTVAQAHVETPLTPPNELVEVTEDTNDAIVRAMAKDPAARFQSYDEFSMALEAARSRLLVSKYLQPE